MKRVLWILVTLVLLWMSSAAIGVAMNSRSTSTISYEQLDAYATFAWFMVLLLLAATGLSAWRVVVAFRHH